ncbi:MAG: nicotinate-nucleotide adenylyltransferase [Planctomycetota bacterium]|nr:nicotinate-nucleotide adenylyltransferase [Planctomycetota bacterium]
MLRYIALFGGTFDPVHNGHLIVARAVAEHCGFERVTFVPTANPPHKQAAQASGEDRLTMLRLATADEELFDICQVELARAGASYTFETLTELRRQHGPDVRLDWIIGADMLEDLPKWHRAAEVVEMATIIIAARPPQRLERLFADLEKHFSSEQLSRLRQSVAPAPIVDISSTDIRDRIRGGKSIRFLVPEAVEQYIRQHRLYAAAQGQAYAK